MQLIMIVGKVCSKPTLDTPSCSGWIMNGRTWPQMFVSGGKQWSYKASLFPKESTVDCESTALLSRPYYLNFGKSLVANEQALIFMSFLDHCKDN